MEYKNIIVNNQDGVCLIQLNRPEALNALNSALMQELGNALHSADNDASIGVMVITGSEKAFAAGVDIKEMQSKTYAQAYMQDFISKDWAPISAVRKPIIAAVSGYALGGGCELAMMCDFIIAADNAKFGQPEINLGIIPGAGGTQRLTRTVGKSKAMDLCLTGRMMDAEEAERCGLIAQVVPAAELQEKVLKMATTIASKSQLASIKTKACVNRSLESSLNDGLTFERQEFYSCFATEDQKEGMQAFVEKRKAVFTNT